MSMKRNDKTKLTPKYASIDRLYTFTRCVAEGHRYFYAKQCGIVCNIRNMILINKCNQCIILMILIMLHYEHTTYGINNPIIIYVGFMLHYYFIINMQSQLLSDKKCMSCKQVSVCNDQLANHFYEWQIIAKSNNENAYTWSWSIYTYWKLMNMICALSKWFCNGVKCLRVILVAALLAKLADYDTSACRNCPSWQGLVHLMCHTYMVFILLQLRHFRMMIYFEICCFIAKFCPFIFMEYLKWLYINIVYVSSKNCVFTDNRSWCVYCLFLIFALNLICDYKNMLSFYNCFWSLLELVSIKTDNAKMWENYVMSKMIALLLQYLWVTHMLYYYLCKKYFLLVFYVFEHFCLYSIYKDIATLVMYQHLLSSQMLCVICFTLLVQHFWENACFHISSKLNYMY